MIHRVHLRFVTVALLAAVACSGGPSATNWISDPGPRALQSGPANLIVCPAATAQASSGLIGPLGGVLTVGGATVLIPPNAVLLPTTFTLTVPASKYLEIEVTPAGGTHYTFAAPVAVTIDYSRCGRRDLDSSDLSVWYIDSQTKALLQNMRAVQDRLTHTVTFTTLHFSGYAVAD
jgi:hypothetical protein